ncbi:hydroxyacylglutathione hydrolase [Buchnera aphidicola]|uniref:hydroxyacylglutathione hydrolase n=1 Tax=Buchnera aphidicola TaxID=9 RepID=UPI00094D02F7|nr:hydroxyacylglutathione hydrolase [Buchnera aphidicola]
MMLKKIPVLIDNYIWILYNKNNFCIIIDPGESDLILKEIKEHKWFPVAILLTHNHLDHVSGVKNIVKHYPEIIVFGPQETIENNINVVVQPNEKIFLLNKEFFVLFTPGHTLGHVAYYNKPYLFCGDTVFSAGCGKVYDKRYLDMYNSIKIIASFPDETILCCAHEYTLSNLIFSMSILPHDRLIKNYYNKIKIIIENQRSSLPTYISIEKKINIFFRTKENFLKEAIGLDYNCSCLETFTSLRIKKDFFWS